MRSLSVSLVLLAIALPAAAQSRHGERAVMPKAAEIALARSAAPEAISGKARVWIWTGQRYAIGDSGTSSVNCFVARLWVPSVEPHCFDEEAAATVLPILMRRAELYAQGMADSLVEREITRGIETGRFRVPGRPAVTYMMSAAQQLVSGQGTAVGPWQPHLMIYYPRLTGDQAGLSGFVPGVGFVENPGTPLAALVIPVANFVPAPK